MCILAINIHLKETTSGTNDELANAFKHSLFTYIFGVSKGILLIVALSTFVLVFSLNAVLDPACGTLYFS